MLAFYSASNKSSLFLQKWLLKSSQSVEDAINTLVCYFQCISKTTSTCHYTQSVDMIHELAYMSLLYTERNVKGLVMLPLEYVNLA